VGLCHTHVRYGRRTGQTYLIECPPVFRSAGILFGELMTQEDWGRMDWLADADTAEGLGLSLARMTVMPGKTSPAHRHPNCNEVIHVLYGSIEERLDQEWTPCAPGDTITAFAGTVHQTRCTSNTPAILMIAYSDDRRIYQEVSPE